MNILIFTHLQKFFCFLLQEKTLVISKILIFRINSNILKKLAVIYFMLTYFYDSCMRQDIEEGNTYQYFIQVRFKSYTGAFTPSARNFGTRRVNTDESLDNNIPVGFESSLQCQRPNRSFRRVFFNVISWPCDE